MKSSLDRSKLELSSLDQKYRRESQENNQKAQLVTQLQQQLEDIKSEFNSYRGEYHYNKDNVDEMSRVEREKEKKEGENKMKGK